jgi:hypothetical protein
MVRSLMLKPCIILLASASLGACPNSGAPPYPPTPMPTPQLAQPAKAQTLKEVYELRERCASDTAAWFKRNYSEPQKLTPPAAGASITASAPEYQNHYSQAQSGCFAILSQVTSIKGSAHSKTQDSTILSKTLWDVNENSKLGSFVLKSPAEMTTCNVLGAACTSQEQWLDMAKPYVAE